MASGNDKMDSVCVYLLANILRSLVPLYVIIPYVQSQERGFLLDYLIYN